jgi:hypothetical protein
LVVTQWTSEITPTLRINISAPSSGLKNKLSKKAIEAGVTYQPASVGVLLFLLFYTENRGDMFLRNVGLSQRAIIFIVT